MGTMMKVSAAVLVAAVCVYFVVRPPQAESPRMTAVEPPATDVELVGPELVSAAEVPATEAVRSPVAEKPPVGAAALAGTNVLRVILEGVTEEDARMTRVTLTGVDERAFNPTHATPEQWRAYAQWVQGSLNRVLGTRLAVDGRVGQSTRRAIITFQQQEGLQADGRFGPKTELALIRHVGTDSYVPRWPAELRESWPCVGLTSEFDLDPFLESVAGRLTRTGVRSGIASTVTSRQPSTDSSASSAAWWSPSAQKLS